MNILSAKKGAALMQVLLVTVILAGMATMLLRAMLSRTTAARQTRKTVSSQMLVNSCMAEVNALWSAKTPEAFKRDMDLGIMYCSNSGGGTTCPAANRVFEHKCTERTDPLDSTVKYQVTAYFETNDEKNPHKNTAYSGAGAGLLNNKREIVYEITTGSDKV